jgi:EAL domain-containing protein (putative c-di-GMP-specific phosphodiesterase class I)
LVAQRLGEAIGPGDSLARAGDDAFTVITEATQESDIITCAHRLLAVFGTPLEVDSKIVRLTASAGIAIALPGALDAEAVLRDAELATIEARGSGRGHLSVARKEQHRESVHRLELEQAMHQAIERDELWLEYQPEISLSTGRVVGAEALLRWRHPRLGQLLPGEFISVADDLGVLDRIGAWVLREACQQAASWSLPELERDDLYVAVNLATSQLVDPDLPAIVLEALLGANLRPHRLCIEVTETALVQDFDTAAANLHRLRSLGVRVALDDFGSGYSSFAYLARLPFDIVKLDGSLVARLGQDHHDAALVESVVMLANRLGLQVVAEGVETAEQATLLAELGCDVVQGYGSGRPGDAASLLDVVWSRSNGA